jgi:hypothetical protein
MYGYMSFSLPKTSLDTEDRTVQGVKFNVSGSESWASLGTRGKKRVTIRKFKGTNAYSRSKCDYNNSTGNTYVDIREVIAKACPNSFIANFG